ncbi:hypothetical protein [Legionella cardiaca]|uniref:Histone-lysine N-methyltransferase, H3 lysine-79 specific n=1 Tax=Legionella cardiaca TaxID=1071983 RepID=A0ABY8AS46_9GAMM|nr:hypothetical protein [Legionella cardiaca]WED43031.1 hypothetical protein PXX05_14205 [Legionella cardiaca]
MLVFLFLLIIAILFGITYQQRRRPLKQWRKALLLDKHFAIYQKLYADVDGFALSRRARISQDALEYVYGEIEFESFIALLSLCKPNASTIFYDLGSGTGKAVIACTLVFNVQHCRGIEILTTLYECAKDTQLRLKQIPAYQEKASRIQFILGNFLDKNLNEASLVFINATAFFGEHWLAVSRHLEQLNPGALVISTSKALQSAEFITTKVTLVRMSWGLVKAFIQQRQPKSINHPIQLTYPP